MAYYRCMGGNSLNPYTVIVTCDAEFAGQEITMSQDGQKTLAKTCPIAEPYVVTFKPMYSGNWKISSVVEGTEAETTIDLSFFGVYETELKAGGFKKWLELGRITKTFSSLDDVLSDQTTLRQLMTIHASADYMLEWLQNDEVFRSALLASKNAMKWIGLRDYICDKLMAIPSAKSAMLGSANWEYILKDHVPVMTSNIAPYGQAIGNNVGSGVSYHYLFDNLDSSLWWSGSTASGVYVGYKFSNPICVKRFSFLKNQVSTRCSSKIALIGSNDGTTWDKIEEFSAPVDATSYVVTMEINNNDKYYLYWAIRSEVTVTGIWHLGSLQFYGRSLNVSVPAMTSNTAPYGEVVTNSTAYDGHYNPYNAFNPSSDYSLMNYTATRKDGYHGYKFNKKVAIKKAYFTSHSTSDNSCIKTATLKYSDDGVIWKNASVQTTCLGKILTVFDSTENNPHQYWALGDIVNNGNPANYAITLLNFYGVDYSEREFASGSTIKYLYDHGVELGATKGDTSILGTLDTTSYKLLRATDENKASASDRLECGGSYANVNGLPNNNYLDISSVNGNNQAGFSVIQSGNADFVSVWLE